MRARLLIVFFAVLLVVPVTGALSPASGSTGAVLAQQPTGEDDEAGGQEGQGGDDSQAESGASQEETSGSTEETGQPWTYQMAFLSLALLLLLALAVARWYYRLIVIRRRGEV